MLEAAAWSAIATVTLLVGMALAYAGVVSLRWTGLIMAFGAGAIVSAAAYQLVGGAVDEEGDVFLPVAVGLGLGAIVFYVADKWVEGLGGKDRMDFEGAQSGGSGTGILLGSLLDGVPESLVLGLSVAHAPQVSIAFVFAVAISNVPQGLGGTAGMLAAGWQRSRITGLWVAVCVASIVAAVIGYLVGVSIPGVTGAMVDAFAAGALFVMLTNSMIPESLEHGGRETGLALTLGFAVATGMTLLQAT